ncbi:MAG: 50S ribosomal protein L11 methyltransferase [Anaerolineae bacterium]|nr:50S ribosomal protein L11 methyltransferase [Anaerolineae bacterium]MCX8067577.1 50S ribosomal protein L11 methyltransferase [Anaerolineae bacterium]
MSRLCEEGLGGGQDRAHREPSFPVMEWLEVSVETTGEGAEAVAEVLSRFASRGVAIEAGPEGPAVGPVFVRAYLPIDDELPQTRQRLEEALWHLSQILPIPEPSFRVVSEEEWAEAWKAHYPVLHLGKRLVIRPSWLPYIPAEGEVVVDLDPGMAFGTGTHPTTQMCLLALEEHVRPGMRVLDLGTGSGILAIAAAKLGAAKVLALDNDPQAVVVARQNVRRNGVADRVQVAEGSLPQARGLFDLIVVNILAKVILEMLQQGLAARLKPAGRLILAGLLKSQEDEVAQALGQVGLKVVARRAMDEWVALEAVRAA